MDLVKEGGSTSHPPLLDGTHYGYWKVRMCAFIKSIDEKAWRLMAQGWKPSTKIDIEENIVPKSESKWTHEEHTLSTQNFRVLNATFYGVDPNQFKTISTTKEAKEAWDILHVAYEGSNAVHESRLELMTTKFANLRMSEKETIDFNGRLCDIASESFALSEKIPKEKLVKKALRSLPLRFSYKATTIRKAKDLKNMRLEELKGSLRTFEIELKKEVKEMKKLWD